MSATDLERLSRRIGLVEQQLLERFCLLYPLLDRMVETEGKILRLEARMDALDKRAGLAGELSIERCQREIDAIMRRGDDEEVLA